MRRNVERAVLSAEVEAATSMARADDRLPFREVRELPEPPRNYWRLVGPGIVAGGVGLSSGEFVLWPYIASQVGLVLLWGALIGVVTQFFLNMEVERYTLATGETVLTGFNRFWRHWGLLFAVMGYFANLWPGWAISSATLTSYLFGGNPTAIARRDTAHHRVLADVRPGGLRRARAADLRQGGRGARPGRARRGVRDQARVVGGVAGGIHAHRDLAARARDCARLQRRRVRRVGRRRRTSVRATGFATKGSAWGSTCRASSAR